MAGIYIHVPYCKQRCIYCDFFTQTVLSSRGSYVAAVCKEIELRKYYLQKEPIETIYLGGGTPSLLNETDLHRIVDTIYQTFDIVENAEITLEANPDDLSDHYLSILKNNLFTRLSIGIQSFDNEELKFLNRRHSAEDAQSAVRRAQAIGFNNMSIDLMYGLPNQSMDTWIRNLNIAIELGVQHISAYHLIYEEGTKLYKLFREGSVQQVEENLSLDMFSEMIDRLSAAGFEHYEISNFAQNKYYSRHNTSYWQGKKYLGIGPAAHSYDGVDRAFNVASISKYIDGVYKGEPSLEIEKLSRSEKYNEFILTGLRTKWGIDLKLLEEKFGNKYSTYCITNSEKYILAGNLETVDNKLKLTRSGIFISDGIMSDLMWI